MASDISKLDHLQLTFRTEPAQRSIRGRPGSWLVWCLIGVGVGVGGWLAGRAYLSSQLSAQLTHAESAEEAILAIQGLMQLDDDAGLKIVQGLEHVDLQVARAAYRALDAQITAWHVGESTEWDARLAELCQALNKIQLQTSSETAGLVSGLAIRIHALCSAADGERFAEILPLCEAILQRTGEFQLRQATAELEQSSTEFENRTAKLQHIQERISLSRVPPPLLPVSSSPAPTEQFTASDPARSSLSDDAPNDNRFGDNRLSGHTLSAGSQTSASGAPALRIGDRIHSSSASPVASIQLVASASQPRRTERLTIGSVGGVAETAATFSIGDDPKTSIVSNHSQGLAVSPAISPSTAQSQEIPMQRISQRVQTVDLQQIPDMGIEQLVRLLASSQPGVAQRAALSLRTQGFDDRRLELASELATCSTSRRVHLLNQLVQSDLEPAPWLIWMAEDGEPEVRLLAASWLNSMVTPEIQRRLRGLLPSESDERVAQVMRQALLVSPDLSLR